MARTRQVSARKNLVLEEIVETAAKVFAEKGFRAATLENVAERFGVSRATLYYYVDSKDDLLRRVIGDFIARQAERMEALRKRDDMTPEEKLREGIRLQVHLFGTHPDVMRVFLREASELPPGLFEEQSRYRRKVDAALRRIVADGIASGHFREVDPMIATFAVFGMINWMHAWYDPDGDIDDEQIADEFSDLVLTGLSADRSNAAPRSIEATMRRLRSTVESLDAEVRRLRGGRRAER